MRSLSLLFIILISLCSQQHVYQSIEMLYLLVCICCLCLIWRLWIKQRSILEPPAVSGKLPILGHSLELGDGLRLYKFIKRASDECLNNDGLVTIHLGPYKIYGIADPEDCLTVMNTCLQNYYIFNFLKPFLGNGLLTADVPTWKKHRKLLNPAFNQHVLESFIEIFNTQALKLVGQFATELGKPIDHEHMLRINNLETICTTSLGVDADDNIDVRNEYLTKLTKLIKMAQMRLVKFWQHSDFIYNMTQDKRIFHEEVKQTMALSKLIIQRKKLERQNLSNTKIKAEKFKPFINHILDLADETGCFTDEEIREETENILAAGHDTTASMMTFVLTLLGSHTVVQEKTFKEIHSVLGNIDQHINKDELPKLVYVEAVLKETLRLYPIAPIIPRHNEKELKLKNYTIKANTDCFILSYGLHRHSIWGPDADQFRPERWLDKKTLPDPKYYGGFGLGKRSCIGKVYAMMSMKILLAHVLRKYRISSDINKMVVEIHLMLRPKSGHHITLTPRNISNGQDTC